MFCTGYIQGLIGGAEVSKQARIAIGDKLKRVPLALFSKRQIGQYISIATTDVNDYEKILTHKSGDLVKKLCTLIYDNSVCRGDLDSMAVFYSYPFRFY